MSGWMRRQILGDHSVEIILPEIPEPKIDPNVIIEAYLIDDTEVQECVKNQRCRNPDGGPDHYQNVHIIEKSTGFELVYGCENTGTGPFKSLEKAKNWFLNQGR